jgi:hypothetical protein
MKKLSLLALCLLLVTLTACGGGTQSKQSDTAPTAKPAAATAKASATPASSEESDDTKDTAEATEAPTASPAKSSPSATPAKSEEAGLSLESRQAGLDKLKTYRMKWHSEWASTESGSTEKAVWDWLEEYVASPQALHWNWQFTNATDQGKAGGIEVWQIENTSYMLSKDSAGQGQCISFSSEDKSQQFTKGVFSPTLLGSVQNAKYVGMETVNGIRTKHYKYDDKSASLAGFGKVSGEIWVAIDGGFTVKDNASWTGGVGFFATNTQTKGDGKWTWEISDVDQAITIKPPDNCGGAANKLPIMPDANDKSTFGDMVSYKSPSKLADVIAFYQKEMPLAGWKAGETEPTITEELATMEFAQGDQKAQVMITVTEGQTQVIINVSK